MTGTEFNEYARCRECDYPLRELESNVCPECGLAFDPNDRSSYRLHSRTRTWRDYASPPTRRHFVFFILLSLYTIYTASFPLAPNFPFACILTMSMIIAAPFVLVGYVRRISACIKLQKEPVAELSPNRRRDRYRWTALPFFLLILSSILIYNWPLKLRWELSKDEFNKVVANWQAGKPLPATPTWIGIYRVKSIFKDGNGLGFVTGDTEADPCGFEFKGVWGEREW